MYEEELEDLDRLFGNNELDINRSLSFSRLSDFDRNGPKTLEKKISINSHSLTIGSLVDDMINPNTNIGDIYYKFDGEKPTATLGKLVNIIIENYTEEPSQEIIVDIIKKNKFWGNIKDPDILMKKWDNEEFWEYIKSYYESNGRIIVTTSDLVLAEDLSNIIKTHEFSKYIFNTNKNRKIYYQQDFEIIYNNVKFRGILDFVIVDLKKKEIEFIDLKTGKDPSLEFMNSFIKYRYYLQESLYVKAFDHICEKLKLNPKEFKLLPFKFLYMSKSERIPLIYTVSNKWHEAAINGFKTNYGYVYKGLDQLIEDVKWHMNNKIFDMSRDIHKTKGVLSLNDNFIHLMNE